MSFRRSTSPIGVMPFDMDKALAARRLGVPYETVDDDFMAGVQAVSEKIALYTDGVYFRGKKPWVRAFTVKGHFASFKWPG